jgi:hypothetical protein
MRHLVMYCGEGDDIPVLLTEDKDEADGLARELVSYYEPSRSWITVASLSLCLS